MLKTRTPRGFAVLASVISAASAANAGGLSDAIVEAEIAPVVVEEPSSSIGLWPVVGLLILGAIVASGRSSDSSDSSNDEKIIVR